MYYGIRKTKPELSLKFRPFRKNIIYFLKFIQRFKNKQIIPFWMLIFYWIQFNLYWIQRNSVRSNPSWKHHIKMPKQQQNENVNFDDRKTGMEATHYKIYLICLSWNLGENQYQLKKDKSFESLLSSDFSVLN